MNATTINIGQRVHSILYGGRDGIVFAVRGEQSPESIRRIGPGVVAGGAASFDIVFDNGGISRGIPESIVRGVQWRIKDAVATPEEIAAAIHHAEHEEARREAEAKAMSERRARERAEHARNHPHLLKRADKPQWSTARVTAENIRRELKRAFPGVKFSVRSDHNSVNIRWTCGPTGKQVDAVVGPFKAGSFNGMEDIYERDDDATFADVFGGAKYVFTSRDFPQDALERCWRQLADGYGVEYVGHATRIGNEWVSDLAHRILQSWPLGETLNGIERAGVDSGPADEFWRAV